jgi:DNA-binding Lrp family transcriptional regulator
MKKIDKKDRMILFHLLHDSRQTAKSIGKKVGLSKDTTVYRIDRLIKREIIKNFTIFLSWRTFGYSAMMTHYKFVNINPIIKKEIIDFFINNKYAFYVSLIEGYYDLQVDFLMGDPTKFEKSLDEIREKYSSNLSFQTTKFYIGGEFFNYAFLLDEKTDKNESVFWKWGQQGLADIDEFDYQILTELSNNARINTKEIANKLNSSVTKVNYRIKKLEEQLWPKIYRKTGSKMYTINIDWSKLGFRWFHLQISLMDYTQKNNIICYLRKNPFLVRSFKFLNLDMDLHFTFLLHNMEQLRKIIEDITTMFPDSINDYQFYSTYKIYKYKILVPELIKDKNPLNREI